MKNVGLRTLGLLMMSFPIGMGIGAAFVSDWVMGGLIAFGTAALTVVTFIGVILTWNGKLTDKDWQEAFRSAANKAGEDNEEIKTILDSQKEN